MAQHAPRVPCATVPGARGTDLPRLTSLRAFAALAVLGYHLQRHTDWLDHERYARYGFTGVGFFFLLSGFVLSWSLRPGDTAPSFYLRRFARIYPAYLVMSLVALAAPVTALALTRQGAAANLLLVQSWFRDDRTVFGLNGVSWSLSCEAFFYLLAPFLIRWLGTRSRRAAMLACGSWVGVCAAVSLALGLTGGGAAALAYSNPALRSGEFVLGVGLATLVRTGWRPRPHLPSVVATLVAALILLSHAHGTLPLPEAGVLLMPFFAALILAAASADLAGRPGWLRHPRVVHLGEVSFAFYLVHELVVLNLGAVVPHHLGRVAGAGLAGAALLLALAAAVALHELVEKPCQRRLLAARRDRRSSPAPAETAGLTAPPVGTFGDPRTPRPRVS